VEDEKVMSKGLGGTPIYRTMTDTNIACTSWKSMPSQDYSSHENMWYARNTKAYTIEESCHKYMVQHAGFFPGRHVKYLVGTRVCFGPDKNAEGRSLYLYDLKNRRLGIVVEKQMLDFVIFGWKHTQLH
jgi:hypothetical protein